MRSPDRVFNLMFAVDNRADDTMLVALRMVDGDVVTYPRALVGALDAARAQAASRRDYVKWWLAAVPATKVVAPPPGTRLY